MQIRRCDLLDTQQHYNITTTTRPTTSLFIDGNIHTHYSTTHCKYICKKQQPQHRQQQQQQGTLYAAQSHLINLINNESQAVRTSRVEQSVRRRRSQRPRNTASRPSRRPRRSDILRRHFAQRRNARQALALRGLLRRRSSTDLATYRQDERLQDDVHIRRVSYSLPLFRCHMLRRYITLTLTPLFFFFFLHYITILLDVNLAHAKILISLYL